MGTQTLHHQIDEGARFLRRMVFLAMPDLHRQRREFEPAEQHDELAVAQEIGGLVGQEPRDAESAGKLPIIPAKRRRMAGSLGLRHPVHSCVGPALQELRNGVVRRMKSQAQTAVAP
jgi:hypothetical protein